MAHRCGRRLLIINQYRKNEQLVFSGVQKTTNTVNARHAAGFCKDIATVLLEINFERTCAAGWQEALHPFHPKVGFHFIKNGNKILWCK